MSYEKGRGALKLKGGIVKKKKKKAFVDCSFFVCLDVRVTYV